MERLPPQNIEAEAAVLGSVLIDPQALTAVAEMLRPDDFYRDAHRLIFQICIDLYAHGRPADLVTIGDELDRRGQMEPRVLELREDHGIRGPADRDGRHLAGW